MEWRYDGNLIALGDGGKKPKIYDSREGRVIKTYEKEFESKINFEREEFVVITPST